MPVKRITKSGGITLPRQVREETGLLPGVAVDVVAGKDGVYFAKHVPACFHCGNVDGVQETCGLEICPACAERIWRCFNDGD